ncbi:MAG: efflux RND transporter periplasmic adaptor subunit [Bacteroides sp.]|uniref:efflux RND transporter periplasmic adaptor subunit n=1 Tax=Bacteroides sp. TaxID=29523 RepID=UPI002FC95D1D
MMRIFSIAAMAFLAVSCGSADSQSASKDAGSINDPFFANVKTIKATLSNAENELTLAGKVTGDPDKTISYTPSISGVIERTYFSLGERVSKGQTLVDIRSTELSSMQAELVSQESELQIAQRELKSAQAMFNDTMLSERELLEAQGKVRQAEAALSKVRADISVYGTSKGSGVFSVKAAMSGYVIAKNGSSGSTLSADGDPLFTIADLSSVWVIANVYAGNLQFVREGMEAHISSVSYPNETFIGKVNAVSQVFDPEDKALKARIVMPNKEMKFKPEMSVMIQLKSQMQGQLVSIPSDAVIFDRDRYFVIVRHTDSRFEIREIVPQNQDSNTTYIASGLKEGEDVVVRNQLLIYSELKAQ